MMGPAEHSTLYSPTVPSEAWNATDEGIQTSDREKLAQMHQLDKVSPSPASASSGSSEDSSEIWPSEYYRLQIEHYAHIRDVKAALRRLQSAIEDHDKLGDIFEDKCSPRNVAVWSHVQTHFEHRIHKACAAVMAETHDMEVLGQTPEEFSRKWQDAEKSGVDRKEGVDALLRPLLIEVIERLSDLETSVGPDEDIRRQEEAWAEQYFLRCQEVQRG